MPEATLVSFVDTCTILGLSRTTIDKLINQGRLHRVKVGRRALITRQSIDAYVNELTTQ